jgi:hypothetical protein
MYSIYRDPPTKELLAQGDILDPEDLRSTLSGHQDYFADTNADVRSRPKQGHGRIHSPGGRAKAE